MTDAAFWCLTALASLSLNAIQLAFILDIRKERDSANRQLSAFDHDGDGKVGGSRKRG